jgi:hypothetical protein
VPLREVGATAQAQERGHSRAIARRHMVESVLELRDPSIPLGLVIDRRLALEILFLVAPVIDDDRALAGDATRLRDGRLRIVARVNFRQVHALLNAIDARFDSCRLEFSEHAFVRVRLAPWWEHPTYVAARRKRYPLAYRTTGDMSQLVTMFPIGLHRFQLGGSRQLFRWTFVQSGPSMWPYEPPGQIFVNAPVAADTLVDAVARRLTVSRAALASMYATASTWASKASYALNLPGTVHAATVAALDELGVDHLVGQRPRPPGRLPVILRLDGTDEIIANDFEMDVPDFARCDEEDPR